MRGEIHVGRPRERKSCRVIARIAPLEFQEMYHPANSRSFSFARCGIDAATQRFHFAPTTAGQAGEIIRSAPRDSAARIQKQTNGFSDSRKRVRIRKRIVKKLTNPRLAGSNRLAGRLPESDDDGDGVVAGD